MAVVTGYGSDDSDTELNKDGRNLEEWHKKFTHVFTFRYVACTAGPSFVFYSIWAVVWVYFDLWFPDFKQNLHATNTMKILCFLVGLLTSLTLKEALDRYRNSLGALIDFRDEFRSFWYFAQMQVLHQPAARVILDAHMILYAVSLVRYLLRKAELKKESGIHSMVQPELRSCAVFSDEEVYDALSSNPTYAELVMVSWLRAMGLLNRDIRLRLRWAREKLLLLLTVQRVKTPKTSVHLTNSVVHIFLLAMPVCNGSFTTKLSTPFVSLACLTLLSLAEELEDPFGVDEHDLPWPTLLGTVSHINMSYSGQEVLHEAMAFFNNGCRTGVWDPAMAKKLFGPDTKIAHPKDTLLPKCDNGIANLALYLTEPDIWNMDIVGNAKAGHELMYYHPGQYLNGDEMLV